MGNSDKEMLFLTRLLLSLRRPRSVTARTDASADVIEIVLDCSTGAQVQAGDITFTRLDFQNSGARTVYSQQHSLQVTFSSDFRVAENVTGSFVYQLLLYDFFEAAHLVVGEGACDRVKLRCDVQLAQPLLNWAQDARPEDDQQLLKLLAFFVCGCHLRGQPGFLPSDLSLFSFDENPGTGAYRCLFYSESEAAEDYEQEMEDEQRVGQCPPQVFQTGLCYLGHGESPPQSAVDFVEWRAGRTQQRHQRGDLLLCLLPCETLRLCLANRQKSADELFCAFVEGCLRHLGEDAKRRSSHGDPEFCLRLAMLSAMALMAYEKEESQQREQQQESQVNDRHPRSKIFSAAERLFTLFKNVCCVNSTHPVNPEGLFGTQIWRTQPAAVPSWRLVKCGEPQPPQELYAVMPHVYSKKRFITALNYLVLCDCHDALMSLTNGSGCTVEIPCFCDFYCCRSNNDKNAVDKCIVEYAALLNTIVEIKTNRPSAYFPLEKKFDFALLQAGKWESYSVKSNTAGRCHLVNVTRSTASDPAGDMDGKQPEEGWLVIVTDEGDTSDDENNQHRIVVKLSVSFDLRFLMNNFQHDKKYRLGLRKNAAIKLRSALEQHKVPIRITYGNVGD